jgi:peptidyl-prolyl cis-trans isomerase SurA
MTKAINLICVFTLLIYSISATAQSGQLSVAAKAPAVDEKFPIFSFGDEMVYNNEFMRVFNKNKRDTTEPTKQEINEYLELYVKFKLKVKEAYSLRMDTVPSFINELAGYRTQLAQPYLTDKTVTENLIKEAYDRSQQEVKASHLLINCALDAKPSDSLAAYQKIAGLRNRIVKGEAFNTVASQYSEDPSAKTNEGNLGYFSAFQMIYSFENAAFSTPVGEVSMPIRTQFGYHLVFVADRRKALADIKVGHIMIKYYNPTQIDSTKQRIDAVYAKLKAGADWGTTVEEFSEDFNTNSKDGELSWFNRTTANIPVEFKDIAYTLENDGDFSEAIKTNFGWHIIKRFEIKPTQTYEDEKEYLRRKVERDSRSEMNKDVVVKRIKVENKYTEILGLDAVKDSFDQKLINGAYIKGSGAGKVLFKIGDKSYTDAMFMAYVATNQTRTNKSLENVLSDMYVNFVKKSNLAYEESILETKYDDFKYIMQEYKDGILLFELTDKEVWSKAVKDTAGLEAFYLANKEEYMWKDRLDATIFSCKNAKIAKKASKQAKKGKTTNEILEKCNADDPLAVKVETKKFEKGSNELLDKISWSKGVYALGNENDRVKFVRVNDLIASSAKALENNMGQATSDYQNFLETEWIDKLTLKYPVQSYEMNVQRLHR